MKWLLLLLWIALPQATAEIYRWVDENGVMNFSNEPPEDFDIKQSLPNRFVSPTIGGSSGRDGRSAPSVVLYSTSDCAACRQAARYFRERRIEYTEIDIEKDREGRRRFKGLGGGSVPVILVGEERLDGFSITAFNALYR